MADESSLSFLPWIRRGLNALGVSGTTVRRKVTVGVDIKDEDGVVQGSSPGKDFDIKGPGDVMGFNPALVARTEPKNGENDFEPNYFPFIEFLEPDFPWRFSLGDDIPGLIPWIVLLVLKKNEFSFVSRVKEKLPEKIILEKKNEVFPIPDLSLSWAWAHVQLAGSVPQNNQDEVVEYIKRNPNLCCSRLMCPRKLEPLTTYSAFVVPTYKIGQLAGFGQSGDVSNKLWDEEILEPLELPVYYQWDFQTSESGDFEKLIDKIEFKDARKIWEKDAKKKIGTRIIDGSRPGYLTDDEGKEKKFDNPQDIQFDMEGVLVPPGFTTSGERKNIALSEFTEEIQKKLNEAIKEASIHDDDGKDPLISIPVYGRSFQKTERIELPTRDGKWNGQKTWVHETNLDRRYRTAASFGTSVVQENQEEYMQECWEQVGAIREANEQLRLASLGKLVSDSVKKRHIDPLCDERFSLITRSYHHYYVNKGKKESFKTSFGKSGLPSGSISQTFKRIVAQKAGIKNQKVFKAWDNAAKEKSIGHIAKKIAMFFLKALIALGIYYLEHPETARRHIENVNKLIKWFVSGIEALFKKPPDDGEKKFGAIDVAKIILLILMGIGIFLCWLYTVVVKYLLNHDEKWLPILRRWLCILRVPVPDEVPRDPDTSSILEKSFERELESVDDSLKQYFTSVIDNFRNISPLKSETVLVNPIDIKKAFRPCFNMRTDLMQRLNSLIKVPGMKSLNTFDPIMKAPQIDLPMYKHLSDRSIDWMVPGLSNLDNNTVILMEENNKFKHSFMVGINHEMGRELVWREFPTDQRGTLFKFFWDPVKAENPPPDIKEIHTWLKALGENVPQEKEGLKNCLVMVMKADLIRRYPETIIFAIKKRKGKEWEDVFKAMDTEDTVKENSFQVFKSIFSAKIGADMIFLGFPFSMDDIKKDKKFDYFFIMMEHPSLPRFGLDEKQKDALKTWDDLSWGQMTLNGVNYISELGNITPENPKPGDPSWGGNAANIAWITYQKPVRIIVPAKKFLGEEVE